MSKIDEKLGEVIDKLTKLAEAQGGAAIDLAVAVAQVNAIAELVVGFVALLVLVCCLITIYWTLRIGWKTDWNDGLWAGFLTAGIVISIPSSILTLVQLTNYWHWVGVSNPKLLLAKHIMKAMGLW